MTARPTNRPPQWTPPSEEQMKRHVGSARELAEICQMSASTVRLYIGSGAVEKTKRGYHVAAFVRWVEAREQAILEHYKPAAGADADAMDPDSESPKSMAALERFRLARAKREEIGLARDRGELLTRESVREAFDAVFGALRTQLNGMVNRLAPLLAGQDERRVRDLLDGDLRATMEQVRGNISKIEFRGPR